VVKFFEEVDTVDIEISKSSGGELVIDFKKPSFGMLVFINEEG
jgi:hypothetical protein